EHEELGPGGGFLGHVEAGVGLRTASSYLKRKAACRVKKLNPAIRKRPACGSRFVSRMLRSYPANGAST
ncbi:MAG: hypothetical protein ACLGG6_09010, partial [Gammaproteobacteria bacterium]